MAVRTPIPTVARSLFLSRTRRQSCSPLLETRAQARLRIIRVRTTGEKVARRVTRRDEFGLSSRQSLGLSVITIEWSTTKKLIEVMRKMKAVATSIFCRGGRGYNDERAFCGKFA